jgi:peptide deformylase
MSAGLIISFAPCNEFERDHMSTLNILHFPDPKLRQKAVAVDDVNDDIRSLVDDMFETMYTAPGIGLAAVQVHVLKRVVVIDISEDKSQPLCFINPEIVQSSGCEGIYEMVSRAEAITVRYLDRDGKTVELEAEGLLAVCIQHEIDHLDGKLFVDYLSEMKRKRIRKKMEKLRLHTL